MKHTVHCIIRIQVNFSEDYIAGLKFSYMTSNGEIVDGRFYGDHKVNLNRLETKVYEIALDERFNEVQCCYSKGIHWIELYTTKGRDIVLGNKKMHDKAVYQEFKIKSNEKLVGLSGGQALKSSTFTYLAFHVDGLKEGEIKEDIAGDEDEENE